MSSVPRLDIPVPADEDARLVALRDYLQLDTEADADFDLLAQVAAEVCQVPYAFISLVDADRVWYKSSHGRRVVQAPRQDDYCSWSILEDGGLDVPDLRADPRTAGLSLTVGPPGYRMYSGANLVSADGHRIGTLCVLDTQAHALSATQRRLLAGLARQVVALMELRLRERQLQAALARMTELAHEDELTGLLNRRALMQALEREVQIASRYGSPLAVAMLDLDHFKRVNDRHGHAAGDAVLRAVGRTLRDGLRSVDISGRLGGEEFALLLPGTDIDGAARLAELLRERIAALDIELPAGGALKVSASLGVAQHASAHDSAEALLSQADAALYRAKQAGRNRVER